MKKVKQASYVLASLILFAAVQSTSAEAGRVDRRQGRQAVRIRQGVKSGELTRDQAKSLRAEEHGIQKAKKEARSDGVVTKDERKEINGMQNEASKDIYKMKHDDVKAPAAGAPAAAAE